MATEAVERALSCEAKGQFKKAYQLFQQAGKLQDKQDNNVKLIKDGLWRLSPLWWTNIRHGDLTLRRCKKEDAGFFHHCYEDKKFSGQFNRQKLWQGNLAIALTRAGRLPPIQTGILMWVIQSESKGVIGLASLSSIDTINLKTELSIGFPGKVPPTYAVKITLLMLHYALVIMPFNKVYTYVYEDNPSALHNTLRLGFAHEGTLIEHFIIPSHGAVNVNL
jgi:RimJ/RimL family protein N-acetyltransferase